ncbi:MAG: SURF1 family protein [Proteobacteria bacterium]|nr:SURF1 family protein [Pseudomonadota bacterium]
MFGQKVFLHNGCLLFHAITVCASLISPLVRGRVVIGAPLLQIGNYQILEMMANQIYDFFAKNFMIRSMQKKFQPALWATFFTLLLFTVLVGLGTWQLKRLEWKTTLLAQISNQMQKPPVPLPETITNPAAWEYRRVTLAGHFLYNHEFLIKPRVLNGVNGYHMLVPFQRASGGVVIVNRGWISDEWMSRAVRPQGTVQVEGIVQLAHPTYFTPPNNPQKNDWYWADIKAMADAAKVKDPLPVIVNIAKKEPGIYPVGGRVEVNITNNHAQYALFWFTMALILQIIFFIRYWKPRTA